MIKAVVFNIQRMSVHDGPGIRTTVFLKGCPLNCVWCHNPESKSGTPVISYNSALCGDCGECAAVCAMNCHLFSETENIGKHRFARENCLACGKCAEKCANGALELAGMEMSCDEIMEIVLRDRNYYKNSGGGLTVSGGEPMFQAEFTAALLAAAKKEGLHTCVESSLYCGFGSLERIIPYTDLFLADFKESDDSLHKKFTGAGNALIKENIGRLSECGARMVLRCPVIPGLNDRADHYDAIAVLARTNACITEVHLEPYNRLGESKFEIFGLPAGKKIDAANDDYIVSCREYISAKTDKPVKILRGS